MAVATFSCVDLIPCLVLLMCPLSVTGLESGRYFWTAFAVNPGHVVSWLFFIACRRVLLGGQYRHWCKYLISASLLIILCTLLHECRRLNVSSVLFHISLSSKGWRCGEVLLCKGKTQRPVMGSLVPVQMILLL